MPLALQTRAPRGTGAILLVDDHPTPRVPRTLLETGCRVDVAATLGQARALLTSQSYSLVVCQETRLAPKLRSLLARACPEVPCVVVPASPEPALVREPHAGRASRRVSNLSLVTARTLTATIGAMVDAIDAIDPQNRSHSHRVTQLALRLGEAVDLGAADLETLQIAALLHDIGKLGVPQQVLCKPGPLDDGEWCAMKQHPVYGSEILLRVGSLGEVPRIIRHHHERIDGAGYPDGLTGDGIPALSRLISIADAYEAMTADRVYRRALDASTARDLIRAGLGTQFDESLGRAFLKLQDLP